MTIKNDDVLEAEVGNFASLLADTSEPNGDPIVWLTVSRKNAVDEDGEDSGAVGLLPDEARALAVTLMACADHADAMGDQ